MMVNASQVDLQRLKLHILAFAHFHGMKAPGMLISNPQREDPVLRVGGWIFRVSSSPLPPRKHYRRAWTK